jgi:hypothetical protein
MRPSVARCLCVTFWLGVCPCLAQAQKHIVIPLVPAANWQLVRSEPVNLDQLRELGVDPAISREYGVKTVEHRVYRLQDNQVDVYLEQATDPSAAYGLFTYYQNEGMAPVKGMQYSVMGPREALMARGRYCIHAMRPAGSEVSDTELSALLILIGGTRPSAESLKELPAPLPSAGMIRGSEKYVLGLEAAHRVLPQFRTDLIGFPQGAELQVADYQQEKGRCTLLAISYPTPQMARRQFSLMENLLGINQSQATGSTYAKRMGSYVFLVLNSDTAIDAGKLLDEFKVSSDVSWDRPYPGDKPFSIQLLELILGNLILVLLLMGFAFMGGVLIVLSRRIAAKWFPDSPWGHPAEGSIITLNLK